MLDAPASPVSPSFLLSYGGLSCQVTLNSERPPTRQTRLKVLPVRLFITRPAKPPLAAADSCIDMYGPACPGLILRFQSACPSTSAHRGSHFPALHNGRSSHWHLNISTYSEFGVQAADSVSSSISSSHSHFPLPPWLTYQPTYLELLSISGARCRPRIG